MLFLLMLKAHIRIDQPGPASMCASPLPECVALDILRYAVHRAHFILLATSASVEALLTNSVVSASSRISRAESR